MYPQRGDNLSRNLAQNVNMLEHERNVENKKPISEKERKAGIIAFIVIAILLCSIVLLFIF